MSPEARPSTLLLFDPARPARPEKDRAFSLRLAEAFSQAGWRVEWLLDRDDPLEPPPFAQAHKVLEPRPFRKRTGGGGKEAGKGNPKGRGSSEDSPILRKRLGSFLRRLFPTRRPLPPRQAPQPPQSTTEKTSLAGRLSVLDRGDIVFFPSGELVQLEELFKWLPLLSLDRPLDTTLHFRFTEDPLFPTPPEGIDPSTLAARLTTGCPFRNLYFHADSTAKAKELTSTLGTKVYSLGEDGGGPGATDILRRFPAVSAPSGKEIIPPSIAIEEFGPLVLLVSAFWGRTGSTSIFDAQTRYLLGKGYLVVRVFVEHWPHYGEWREKRVSGFLAENFRNLKPHLFYIVERNEDPNYVEKVASSREFKESSPLGRMLALFADPVMEDPGGLEWAGKRAAFALVNHLPHVPPTRKITKAPIILETHDVFSELLEKHGVPGFVPTDGADTSKQLEEEKKVWTSVEACVNLTPEDHALVTPFARKSFFIRPYSPFPRPPTRTWPEVVSANNLPEPFQTANRFDVMLWGDWHEGNVRGVKWFVEKVVPLSEKLKKARILLVGRVQNGLPEKYAQKKGLLATGFVDDLGDFFFRSKVLVIPDQGGSGISIKAMEAFAYGRPFSTTSGGLRGVDLGDTGFRPIDDPSAFAADLEGLLSSQEAREKRAEVARKLYEINFSREVYEENWDKVLEETVPDAVARASRAVERARPMFSPNKAEASSHERPSARKEGKVFSSLHKGGPRLSVVVCTYNRYDVLPDAIDSLLRQEVERGFLEILVIDNSPDQEKARAFGAQYDDDPRVKYFLEPVPGLSNARNRGTGLAKAPFVAFIDDDAIASPQWAEEITAAFDAFSPDAAVVGGRVLPHWISPKPPWLAEELLIFLSVVDWGGPRGKLDPAKWLVGCNIAFDKKVLLEAGGFSTALGRIGPAYSLLSNEETEVTQKIHAMGKISIYAPDALVKHVIDPGRLSRDWFRKRMAWQAVSDYLKDGKSTSEYAKAAMEHLKDLLKDKSRRIPPGFFLATDDGATFQKEMGIVYDLMVATLAGGVEVEDGR